MRDGFCAVGVAPSPKLQAQLTTVPSLSVEVSEKLAVKSVVLNVKPAWVRLEAPYLWLRLQHWNPPSYWFRHPWP